ncbi:MAG: ComF family protein [Methyloligellaceae bacterium]
MHGRGESEWTAMSGAVEKSEGHGGKSRGRVARPLKRAFGFLADILLPPLCPGCRTGVSHHGGLCAQCWREIDFVQAPVCDRLGIPLAYAGDGPLVSAAALAEPPDYDRARAVARYEGAMRRLVHDLKYRDRHDAVALYARWLQQAGCEFLGDAELLVPVPLYRLRLWRRRFNQAALLAARLSAETGIAHDPLCLLRIRRTASQVGLSARQRRRNVSGAFAVPQARRDAVAGRRIVLVDDVITTGATANACARALKRAGAQRVDVLALARVVDPLAPPP